MTEYDDYFEEIFKKFARGREDHEFRGYNQSMGIWIEGKEHYKHEMKKRRMVPYEEAHRLAEEYDKKHPHKDYGELTPHARDVIESLRLTADKNGNITLGGRAIAALKDLGVIQSQHTPQQFCPEGGFA